MILVPHLHAGPSAAPPASAGEPDPLDRLWGLATLYRNESNPWIEEFKLRGRYQGQYHWLDSKQGDDEGWEDRRSRLGFEAKLFEKKVEARLDFESDDGFEEAYAGLVDAYVEWEPSENFSLTVGRQRPQIGAYDWLQSIVKQPTFERSQIFGQLRVNRVTGAVLEGESGAWSWQAGVYSNDIDKEFGSFDGGVTFGGGLGYDWKEELGVKKALTRVDWLHSESSPADTLFNRYSDLASATFWLEDGRWSLVAEAFGGFGGEGADGDIFGFFIQHSFDLVPDRLQILARYSFATGDGPDSVVAQSRYERLAPDLDGGGRGDQYQAIYLGLQYFIHGDNLKLMAGAEYADLDGGGNGGDFSGWTYLAGVRFAF